MRNMTKLFLLLILLAFLPKPFHAQSNELVLLDFNGSGGKYLDDQIKGDTTAFGTRNNPNRVFVLKRNGAYLVKSQIRNTNYILRIKAEAGTGSKPIIYNFKNPATNAYANPMIDVQGDLWLQNLIVVGYSEFIPTDLSLLPQFIIAMNSVGFNLTADGCVFHNARQSCINVNAGSKTVKFTNCTFANGGNILATNAGNGRAIDFRVTSCDSAIIQNCNFVNFIDRIIRHLNSTAAVNYFYFDHNTISNTLSYHGHIALGWLGKSATITNNLFIDNFVLGNDSTDDARLVEYSESGEKDRYGNYIMPFVLSVPNGKPAGALDTTKWVVRNNYYSVTPTTQAWYDSKGSIGLGNLIPLTKNIKRSLGADSLKAFFKETTPIAFTKTTKIPINFCNWMWAPNPQGAGKQKVQTGFTTWPGGADMDRRVALFYSDSLNLKYPTTAKAYTGADKGLPAGATTWWGIVLDVQKTDVIPTTFSLEQNYPNPFNPTTKISYNIPKGGQVKLEVFDILGRKVATLVDQFQQVGQYKVDFVGSKLSSGVYIYQLSTQDYVMSKKMMLIK